VSFEESFSEEEFERLMAAQAQAQSGGDGATATAAAAGNAHHANHDGAVV
jgi:hypothetical protein